MAAAATVGEGQEEMDVLKAKNATLENEVERLTALLKQSERKRKKQKLTYEKSMDSLGVRLVDFENSLRKEQREIQELLNKKDQQIKVREELTKTLQERLDQQQHCRQCGYPKTSSSIEVDWQLEIDDECNQLIKRLPPLSLPPPEEPTTHIGFTNHRPFRPKSKLSPVAEESEVTFSSSLRNVHADINPDHFHAALTASLNILNEQCEEVTPSNSVDDREERSDSDKEFECAEEDTKDETQKSHEKTTELLEELSGSSVVEDKSTEQNSVSTAPSTAVSLSTSMTASTTENPSTSTCATDEKSSTATTTTNEKSSAHPTAAAEYPSTSSTNTTQNVLEIEESQTVVATAAAAGVDDSNSISTRTVSAFPNGAVTQEPSHRDTQATLSSVLLTFCSQLSMDTMRLVNNSVREMRVSTTTATALPNNFNNAQSTDSQTSTPSKIATTDSSIQENIATDPSFFSKATVTTKTVADIDSTSSSMLSDSHSDSIDCYITTLIGHIFIDANLELSRTYSTERNVESRSSQGLGTDTDAKHDRNDVLDNSITTTRNNDSTINRLITPENTTNKLFSAAEKVALNFFPTNITQLVVDEQNRTKNDTLQCKNEKSTEEILRRDSSNDSLSETSSAGDFSKPNCHESSIKSNGQRAVPPSLDTDLEISVIVDTILQEVYKSVFNELRNKVSSRENRQQPQQQQQQQTCSHIKPSSEEAPPNEAMSPTPLDSKKNSTNRNSRSEQATTKLHQEDLKSEPQNNPLENGFEEVVAKSNEIALQQTTGVATTENVSLHHQQQQQQQPATTSVDQQESTSSASSSSKKKKKKKRTKKKKKNNVATQEEDEQQPNGINPLAATGLNYHERNLTENENTLNENYYSSDQFRSSDNSSSGLPTEEELTPRSAKMPLREEVCAYPPMRSPEEDKYSLLVDEQLDVLDDLVSDEDACSGTIGNSQTKSCSTEAPITPDGIVGISSTNELSAPLSGIIEDAQTEPLQPCINGLPPPAEEKQPINDSSISNKSVLVSKHCSTVGWVAENGILEEYDVVVKPPPLKEEAGGNLEDKENPFTDGHSITTKM